MSRDLPSKIFALAATSCAPSWTKSVKTLPTSSESLSSSPAADGCHHRLGLASTDSSLSDLSLSDSLTWALQASQSASPPTRTSTPTPGLSRTAWSVPPYPYLHFAEGCTSVEAYYLYTNALLQQIRRRQGEGEAKQAVPARGEWYPVGSKLFLTRSSREVSWFPGGPALVYASGADISLVPRNAVPLSETDVDFSWTNEDDSASGESSWAGGPPWIPEEEDPLTEWSDRTDASATTSPPPTPPTPPPTPDASPPERAAPKSAPVHGSPRAARLTHARSAGPLGGPREHAEGKRRQSTPSELSPPPTVSSTLTSETTCSSQFPPRDTHQQHFLVVRLEPHRLRARLRSAPYTLGPFGPPPTRGANHNVSWYLGLDRHLEWLASFVSNKTLEPLLSGMRKLSGGYGNSSCGGGGAQDIPLPTHSYISAFPVPPSWVQWQAPWYLALDGILRVLSECIKATSLTFLDTMTNIDSYEHFQDAYLHLLKEQNASTSF